MKKSITNLLLLCCYLAIAQIEMSAQTEFYISSGETVTATGSESIYSNEALVNNGVITMGAGTLELGSHYTNNGTTTLTNATLKLSGGATQSLSFGATDSAKKIDLNKENNLKNKM